MLLVELFQYLDNNLGTESFFDFIEKRLEQLLKKIILILIKMRMKSKI